MINGIYFTTSGMNVDQKRMEILSNNLANINSTGFKKRSIVFVNYEDMLLTAFHRNLQIGSIEKGLIVEGISVDLSSGALKYTQNPLDLAINDNNFFSVQDNSGNELLTKNGSLGLDSENFLINSDGYRVMGLKGAIKIGNPEKLVIDSSGYVITDGQVIDSLKIASVASEQDLFINNSSYYTLKEGAQAAEGQDIMIKQGFLETSNINGVSEMADMIAVMSSYEINQKIIKIQDETLNKAVNNVGKMF